MTRDKRCKYCKRQDCNKESNTKCLHAKCLHAKCVKADNIKAKNIKANDIQTDNIVTKTLTTDSANIQDLTITSINGIDFDCLTPYSLNVSGVITPVVYVDGEPQQPPNPGNFNQAVLNDLWFLNQLALDFTNLDADSGRLRNAILNNFYNCQTCPTPNLTACNCPVPGYAVFTGSILAAPSGSTSTQLKVTAILAESLTNCPPGAGTIKIGDMIFGSNQQFLSSTIISQVSGTPGGIGTYLISNKFNDYSQATPSQRMLALANLTTEECVGVPLRIYGVETLSVGPFDDCGHVLDAIAYNLNMANKTLSTKVAAVYVQVGWQAPGEGVSIQGLVIDTRQFDPSILSFGEQMNNNVLLPTDLINSIAIFNVPGRVTNAVAQLAVYVEDGLEILIPDTSTSSNRANTSNKAVQAVTGVTTNFSASFTPSAALSQDLQQTFTIPPGAKTVRFNAFGGGGGGSSTNANIVFNPPNGGGGGGGSGFSLGDDIVINLENPVTAFTTINVVLGMGGSPDNDGGMTVVTLSGPNGGEQYGAAGGKKGGPVNLLVAGDGGAGYYGGGGGGSADFTGPGNGGMGSANAAGCQNGKPGCTELTFECSSRGQGGRGGAAAAAAPAVCQSGGRGGEGTSDSGGGGGGGGVGGGNGGLIIKGGDGRGGDATQPAAGGGGAAGNGYFGGKGANGYFTGPFYTF